MGFAKKTEGEKAKCELFYELVKHREVGEVLTFDMIRAITGFNVRVDRGVIYGANKLLLENDSKMLISQRGVGYKVALPHEQLGHGAFRRVRASRQVKKGIREISFLRTEDLSAEQRQYLTDTMNRLQMSLRALRKKNVEGIRATQASMERQKVSMERQKGTLEGIEKIMAEIAAIKERLSK